ncbi:MAG: hypothetical protein KIT72_17850 [Polyangiaceae bacterium]|nr:hypothetical protein [Polyangiaceae bacterium]MCW5792280.1 hypothetical protein [Polyangiaceae bacterium]
MLCSLGALASLALGCSELERYDTKAGEAYCGNIVGAEFIRTPERQGGFSQELRARITLDVNQQHGPQLVLTTSDVSGPCAPRPTFDDAPLVTVPELSSDPFSQLTFGDGRDYNFVGWVESTCRGPVMAVVSLMNDSELELRLLKPPVETEAGPRPAFALFRTKLSTGSCGF